MPIDLKPLTCNQRRACFMRFHCGWRMQWIALAMAIAATSVAAEDCVAEQVIRTKAGWLGAVALQTERTNPDPVDVACDHTGIADFTKSAISLSASIPAIFRREWTCGLRDVLGSVARCPRRRTTGRFGGRACAGVERSRL